MNLQKVKEYIQTKYTLASLNSTVVDVQEQDGEIRVLISDSSESSCWHSLSGEEIYDIQKELRKEQPLYLIDLDGIVANSTARFERATNAAGINWRIAFDPELIALDTVIDGAMDTLERLAQRGTIVYISSRPESLHNATMKWMKKNGVPIHWIALRPQFAKTLEWKEKEASEQVAQIQPARVIFIDDEMKNCEAVAAALPEVVCYASLAECLAGECNV